jgi:hypothetical protein
METQEFGRNTSWKHVRLHFAPFRRTDLEWSGVELNCSSRLLNDVNLKWIDRQRSSLEAIGPARNGLEVGTVVPSCVAMSVGNGLIVLVRPCTQLNWVYLDWNWKR